MTKTINILYAEDDETLAFLTRDNLMQNSYDVYHCVNGKNCLEVFQQHAFDICILDIMLPGIDGFELATEIRKFNSEVPIIFLSAKSLKEDRIKGLKLGADDYLVKPFSIEELVLKIEVFLKRTGKSAVNKRSIFTIGNCYFDPESYVFNNGVKQTTLTKREAELLELFLNNKNKVLKREDILRQIWGDDDYFLGRSLDVFISRLRKLLAVEKQIAIENLHGIGFKFTEK